MGPVVAAVSAMIDLACESRDVDYSGPRIRSRPPGSYLGVVHPPTGWYLAIPFESWR